MPRWMRKAAGGVLGMVLGSGTPVLAEEPATDFVQEFASVQAPIVCTGSLSIKYNPPMSSTPRDITAVSDVDYRLCVSSLGEQVRSGSAHVVVILRDTACNTEPLASADETMTITWKTAPGQVQTSTVTLRRQSTDVQGSALVITFQGAVTAGKYKGATVIRENTYLNGQATDGCLTGGTTERLDGVSVLTLVPPPL